jgi:predicted acylesterase/phospholipase RssA
MTIKHIVISGGGPSLLQYLSSIQNLNKHKIIDLTKIESIYGTSAGSIIGVLLCLKFDDWDTINDYVIKRPWHELFHMKINYIFDAYKNRGIYGKKIVEKIFKPLLAAKDISLNISLKEFYEYSKIELHFYSFEVNHFVTEDISYLTHPDLELLDAILMSCAIPILFSPVIKDDKCYIDGGVCVNYPLKYCIEQGRNEKEILGICNQYDNHQKNHVDSNSNLLDFILCFFFKMFASLSTSYIVPNIKYQIICHAKYLSLNYLRSSINSIEIRKELYEKGIDISNKFIEKFKEDLNQVENLEDNP